MNTDSTDSCTDEKNMESVQYLRENIDKETIMERLRKEGFRVTRQRDILIDIILEEECTCCKEIYCLASRRMKRIGIATIYRTINALEKIGALKQWSSYQITGREQKLQGSILAELEDGTVMELGPEALQNVLEKGLQQCGYSGGQHVVSVRQGDLAPMGENKNLPCG